MSELITGADGVAVPVRICVDSVSAASASGNWRFREKFPVLQKPAGNASGCFGFVMGER